MRSSAIMSPEQKAYDTAQEQYNPYIWILNITVQSSRSIRLLSNSSTNANSLGDLSATTLEAKQPVSGAADQLKTLSQFKLFSKLPFDVRFMIWELVLPEGRMIFVTSIKRYIHGDPMRGRRLPGDPKMKLKTDTPVIKQSTVADHKVSLSNKASSSSSEDQSVRIESKPRLLSSPVSKEEIDKMLARLPKTITELEEKLRYMKMTDDLSSATILVLTRFRNLREVRLQKREWRDSNGNRVSADPKPLEKELKVLWEKANHERGANHTPTKFPTIKTEQMFRTCCF
ncbi:hypothetical protein IFR05_003093 [Cadophora sp. M221]|nr:hypothetical protein IFR05_003093 [Cadophora sp. M221]